MSPHPLNNIEIKKHYQNKSKFNTVYSRNMSLKIKYVAHIIGTHWAALYVSDINETYYNTFLLDLLILC